LVSLYSFYHYLVINIVEATGGVRRVLAVYHSPNQLALFLDRVVPAALALGLPEAGERLETWWRRGVTALAAAVLGTGALFLTYSRGAWLAVGIACLVVAAFRGRRILLPAIVTAAAGAAMLLARISPGRLLSEQTSMQRPTIWGAALNMLRDHPIFGVGPDNFLYFYRDRGYLPPEGWAEPDISHPHNIVLDAWLRTGALGLLALMAAQWVFWSSAWRELRSSDNATALALAAGMLAAMIHGLFDNGYFLIDLAVLFWAGYAAMLALAHERTSREIG
jgi:O-antigen ligase